MKKMPKFINGFKTWEEVELVLNVLVDKYGYKLVCGIDGYKNAAIHEHNHAIHISGKAIYTTASKRSEAMPLKTFRHQFIQKPISFKTIY